MTIKIPEKCENLFLDVGLSIDAPNSALWLVRDSKSFVIGVEPSPENTAILKKGRPPTVSYPYLCLNENAIIRNGTKLNTVDNRFCLLQYAIDNVSAPSSAPFYMTDDRNTGCSSLLKPTDKLGLDIKQIYQTPVVSLKTILDNVSFLKFKYITLLKTDTQVEDIIKFMKDKNFSLLADSHYDHLYLNHPLASKLTTLEKDFSTRLSQLLDMAMDNYEEQTQN